MPVPMLNERAIANRRLLRDDVFERLLDAIIDGTLEPGERLRDEDLGAWLGVSRTPIREAITRLVDMGLVDMEPNRYTRVSTIDFDRYLSAHRVVSTLFGLAAELAMPKISEKSITAISTACAEVFEYSHESEAREQVSACWTALALLPAETENPTLIRSIDELGPDLRRVSLFIWPHMEESDVKNFFNGYSAAVTARDTDALVEVLEVEGYAMAERAAKAARAAGLG